MKSILFSSLLLILGSCFVQASELNSNKNNHYTLMQDRLNEQTELKDEREKLVNIFNDLIKGDPQKMSISGCDVNRVEISKAKINAALSKINFYSDYNQQLKKYNLSLNEIKRLYTIEESNLSNACIGFNVKAIIQLENNQLMIPYNNLLVFYKPLSNEDENKITNLKNNEQCLETEQGEMERAAICYYKNMTILEVYNAMSFYPNYIFRNTIEAGKNFSATYADKSVNVEYKWSGKNKLEITQHFEGGVNNYTFIYQDNKTKLISVASLKKVNIMSNRDQIDFMQFDVIIHPPKVWQLDVVEVSEQLDKALAVYQKYVNPKVNWYYFSDPVKIEPELLVYNTEGLTELVAKKLTSKLKGMEKTGDLMILFTSDDVIDPYRGGNLIIYDASKFLNKPIKSKIDFFFKKYQNAEKYNSIVQFITELAEVFYQSYIEIDLKFTFEPNEVMFSNRIGTSMIVYIPVPLNANDYPEAYKIIPIYHDDKQVGTVIVSLDHFPNRDNIEDVKTINRLDMRLREADLLPVRTDL